MTVREVNLILNVLIVLKKNAVVK